MVNGYISIGNLGLGVIKKTSQTKVEANTAKKIIEAYNSGKPIMLDWLTYTLDNSTNRTIGAIPLLVEKVGTGASYNIFIPLGENYISISLTVATNTFTTQVIVPSAE